MQSPSASLLITYFLSQGITEPEAERIAGAFEKKHIPKGDYFVREGKLCKHLGFIEKGYLQYVINMEGEEKTTYAVGEHSFFTSIISYLKELPAQENIRAIIDTDVWIISKQQFTKLLEEIPGMKAFYIGILEWQICCIDESRLDALMLSAEERYLKMMTKEPILMQQLPVRYIASILGVTPRHLSRIRNQIR